MYCPSYGTSWDFCQKLNHSHRACWYKYPNFNRFGYRKQRNFACRNGNKLRKSASAPGVFVETLNSAERGEEIPSDLLLEVKTLTSTTSSSENKDVGFQVISDEETAEEIVKCEQISASEAPLKMLKDSDKTKDLIELISEENSDKLAIESCKDSVNEETVATEPKEINDIPKGRFGYSVMKSAQSQDQSRESKHGVDNSEVDAQELKNWVLSQIQSEDELRFFESKYIRKIVTDLGGEVLKEFVNKLRQLKKQEKQEESWKGK